MSNFYRIMLGKKSAHFQDAIDGGFVGVDFGIHEDLTGKVPDEWQAFNKRFIPVYQAGHPGKSKVAAGLACAALWTIARGMQIGDIVLCPDGQGAYHAGEVKQDYSYASGQVLPHRRLVHWRARAIQRTTMSTALRNTVGAANTVVGPGAFNVHRAELERLLAGTPTVEVGEHEQPDTEDLIEFEFEKYLEDFLVTNWDQTSLSGEYSIFEEDGELVGQQYVTDAGTIDVLAISKDKTRLLVVELKRGQASDVVVGQVLRYMGYIKENVAEKNQTVEGVIIALEGDKRMRWALMNVPSISFYRYQVSFKLIKA